MFGLGYNNAFDDPQAIIASPQAWEAGMPLSNLSVRQRSAKARTVGTHTSITLEIERQGYMGGVGILGLPDDLPVGTFSAVARCSVLSMGGTDAGTFARTFNSTLRPYTAGRRPVPRDFWIDFETDREVWYLQIVLTYTTAIQWTIERAWASPFWRRADIDFSWADRYVDTGRTDESRAAEAYATPEGSGLVVRERDVTLSVVPYADIYSTTTDEPSLQEVLMNLGSRGNCVCMTRSTADTAVHERLTIYGRQSAQQIPIDHQGGDHYRVQMSFREER